MTKVIDGITVLTYEEWKKSPAIKELADSIEVCDTCDGTGEHECDCGDTHECGACDGSGKLQDICDVYERLLRGELEKLLQWRDGLPIKHPSNPDLAEHKHSSPVLLAINIPGSK